MELQKEERSMLPPEGFMLAIVDGVRAWIPAKPHAPKPLKILTSDQQERIRKLQYAFRKGDPRPLSVWLCNFAQDDNPDSEIDLKERLLPVWKGLCAERNATKQSARWELLRACYGAMQFETAAQMIAGFPEFQNVKDLWRVFERVHGADLFRPLQVSEDNGRITGDAKKQLPGLERLDMNRTCPICNKAVSERGACSECLPYNIYYHGKHLSEPMYEACRQAMLRHRGELYRMPFAQVGANGDVDAKLAHLRVKIERRAFLMVPFLDSAARKSVLFVDS